MNLGDEMNTFVRGTVGPLPRKGGQNAAAFAERTFE
jgi:hypothetical protein